MNHDINHIFENGIGPQLPEKLTPSACYIIGTYETHLDYTLKHHRRGGYPRLLRGYIIMKHAIENVRNREIELPIPFHKHPMDGCLWMLTN